MFIYIHIPFCTSICNYCDFPKLLYHKKYVYPYLDALRKEIVSRYQQEEVTSIYIGGGTPTSLDVEELTYLLEITKVFKKKSKIEFTIESNIESLTEEKIRILKAYGVNRVSLGVQSFQEEILKELGRHHTKADVFKVVAILKRYGIFNISIDYMYGVSSNLEKVKEDMETFFELDIPHISCYSLIIEENTVFGIEKRKYIEEEKEVEIYRYLEQELVRHQYIHYEVSNYAKEGYFSIHNLNYWENGEYYGFGLGAVSFLNHYRITNTKNQTKYLKNEYLLQKEYEDIKRRISNEFILGLRKVKGISIDKFYQKYQQNVLEYPEVKTLLKEKKLELRDGYLCISSKYFYLANEILIYFV